MHPFANRLPTICHPFANHLPSICQPFAIHLPSICHPFANHLPTICQPFANHLPTICQPFANHLPTICQGLPPRICPDRLAIAAPGQGQSRQQTHRARTHHSHGDVLREAEARGKNNHEKRWINHQLSLNTHHQLSSTIIKNASMVVGKWLDSLSLNAHTLYIYTAVYKKQD